MNKDKIIIFGNNNFAEMMKYYIEQFTNNKVSCFTVDRDYIIDDNILGLPVIPFEEIAERYPSDTYKFLIALGYKEMNFLREKIFAKVKEMGYEIEGFVHPSASINTTKVGVGNIFLDNVFVGWHSEIGDGNIFWNGVNISHNANIGNYNYFSPSATLAGNVKINNNCFLGTNCTIKNNVLISNRTLIGAGCFLNNDSLEDEVYVPARALKLNQKSNQIKFVK